MVKKIYFLFLNKFNVMDPKIIIIYYFCKDDNPVILQIYGHRQRGKDIL